MNNEHDDEKCENPHCDACKYGMEEVERRERMNLEKYGWIAHVVPEYEGSPLDFNLHTHGVQENFDHPDFEVVLPMNPVIIMGMLHNIVNRIKEGETFVTGRQYTNLIYAEGPGRNLPVEFAESTECGRRVLRVILPDEDLSTNRANMKHPFVHQWEGIDGIVEKFETCG